MEEKNYSKRILEQHYVQHKTETWFQTILAAGSFCFLFMIIAVMLVMAGTAIQNNGTLHSIDHKLSDIRAIDSEARDTANMTYDYLTNDYTND